MRCGQGRPVAQDRGELLAGSTSVVWLVVHGVVVRRHVRRRAVLHGGWAAQTPRRRGQTIRERRLRDVGAMHGWRRRRLLRLVV